ncbi:chaplin [Streptomyces longisporoflavus]|uniref:chaplin n=1 Tax=Streptomyces longisporoflavus TaxID=28044 RepID=UPI00167DF1CB|nr:chaplin [Streptomyces longisporoflavus]
MRQVTRKGLITVAAATGVLAISGGYAQADSGAGGGTSDSPGVLSGNSVQLPVHVPVNVCGNSVNVVGVLNPAMGNNCANTSDGGGNGSHKPSGGGSSAHGHSSDSPGVGSGNDVQLPVDVPVNVCGNSVTIVGVGNATAGDDCVNDSGDAQPPGGENPPGGPEQPPGGENPPGGPEQPPGGENPPGGPEQPPGGENPPGGPEQPPGGENPPGGPEQPPGGPQQPEHPGKPEQPGKPGEPGQPGTPGEKPSDDRAMPNQPGSPNEPGTPNQPGAQIIAQPKGSETLAQTGGELPIGVVLPVGAGMLLAGTVLYRRARSAA